MLIRVVHIVITAIAICSEVFKEITIGHVVWNMGVNYNKNISSLKPLTKNNYSSEINLFTSVRGHSLALTVFVQCYC